VCCSVLQCVAVWSDTFVYATWPVQMCVTCCIWLRHILYLHVWPVSLVCAIWTIHMCVTCRILIRDMTHLRCLNIYRNFMLTNIIPNAQKFCDQENNPKCTEIPLSAQKFRADNNYICIYTYLYIYIYTHKSICIYIHIYIN